MEYLLEVHYYWNWRQEEKKKRETAKQNKEENEENQENRLVSEVDCFSEGTSPTQEVFSIRSSFSSSSSSHFISSYSTQDTTATMIMGKGAEKERGDSRRREYGEKGGRRGEGAYAEAYCHPHHPHHREEEEEGGPSTALPPYFGPSSSFPFLPIGADVALVREEGEGEAFPLHGYHRPPREIIRKHAQRLLHQVGEECAHFSKLLQTCIEIRREGVRRQQHGREQELEKEEDRRCHGVLPPREDCPLPSRTAPTLSPTLPRPHPTEEENQAYHMVKDDEDVEEEEEKEGVIFLQPASPPLPVDHEDDNDSLDGSLRRKHPVSEVVGIYVDEEASLSSSSFLPNPPSSSSSLSSRILSASGENKKVGVREEGEEGGDRLPVANMNRRLVWKILRFGLDSHHHHHTTSTTNSTRTRHCKDEAKEEEEGGGGGFFSSPSSSIGEKVVSRRSIASRKRERQQEQVEEEEETRKKQKSGSVERVPSESHYSFTAFPDTSYSDRVSSILIEVIALYTPERGEEQAEGEGKQNPSPKNTEKEERKNTQKRDEDRRNNHGEGGRKKKDEKKKKEGAAAAGEKEVKSDAFSYRGQIPSCSLNEKEKNVEEEVEVEEDEEVIIIETPTSLTKPLFTAPPTSSTTSSPSFPSPAPACHKNTSTNPPVSILDYFSLPPRPLPTSSFNHDHHNVDWSVPSLPWRRQACEISLQVLHHAQGAFGSFFLDS